MYSVSKELEAIVNKISCRDVHFAFASMPEVSTNFSLRTAIESLKGKTYPAIVILADINEESKTKNGANEFEFDIKGYVIDRTRENYSTLDRISKIYRPTLEPIFNEFFIRLNKSVVFTSYYKKDVKRENQYYLGSMDKGQNTLNQVVDAIYFEIKGLNKLRCFNKDSL